MKPNRSPYSEVPVALSAALLLPHRSHAQTAGYHRTVLICPLDDHAGPFPIAFPGARAFPDPSARLARRDF
jgi:hypothetical protein